MDYIPKRIYVKISPKTAIKLSRIARDRDMDPRKVASELLTEKVKDVVVAESDDLVAVGEQEQA